MKQTAEEMFLELTEACAKLGWVIAMQENDGVITGIITGQLDYVSSILSDLEDGDDFEIYEHGVESETELH